MQVARPLFAFSFFSALTHENMNEAAYMDGHLERFFQSLNDSGGLENTAVVLFSDHGVRFGSSREYRTRMGWYEENMPLLMIAMPESFRRRHAQMMATLHSNQHRLTTPFDVHETIRRLVDISRPYDDRQRIADGRQGVSLFDVTLGNRTCKDASIAPVYCECQLSQCLPVDEKSHQVRCLMCCLLVLLPTPSPLQLLSLLLQLLCLYNSPFPFICFQTARDGNDANRNVFSLVYIDW